MFVEEKDWSLPAWGVWIEIPNDHLHVGCEKSLPAWGVWIEISREKFPSKSETVAPRMGSVD